MASDKFVSRGGDKLQAAIGNWKLDLGNLVVLDVGSSTGGFVDCLLQNGAGKVYALDTSYGELAWKLRNDPRVVVMERTNILWIPDQDPTGRRVVRDDIGKVDIVTIDAGWTKLELVLPIVKKFLKPNGKIIALLKPHYETEKKNLVKGVVPSELVEQIKNQVLQNIQVLGFKVEKIVDSPILGGAGNQEYLLLIATS